MTSIERFCREFDARQAAELQEYGAELIGKVVSVFVGDLWEPPARPVTWDGEEVVSVRATCHKVIRRQGRAVALLRLLDDHDQEASAPAHAVEVRPGDN